MLFSSIVVIAPLQSNTFYTLSTDDESVSDGKETEGKTNRKCHPPIDNKVSEEMKYWHIISNDGKKYIGF